MPQAMEATLQAELVSFAEELADAARKEILPYWRQPIGVESKDEPNRPVAESPVTIADRNAETAMRKLIEARYPKHGICGEEFGNVRMDAEFCWVLDPIDGTKSFITGKPLFGTLIGLCHNGRPMIGVIDQCVLKERWVGIVGSGTTLNGQPVHARGAAELKDAMLYATTPHMFHAGFESERFAALRDTVKRPLYGADCYAYALVASGFGADLVCEADLGIYDYMALVPVISGAGGIITDWDGNELVLQRKPGFLGRTLAAANESLHKAALGLLRAEPSDKPISVLKPHLRTLTPYLPPLDGRSAKEHLLFDFNERTVPVDPEIPKALKAYLDGEELRRYPAYGDLNKQIAAYAGVREEECIFTNGSDQGIDLVIRCCCPQGTEAIIPSPTFAMYEQAAKTEGLVIKSPHFTRESGFPLEEILALVGPQTSIIICCNPNNPTGTPIPREAILKLAEQAPHVAILADECYYEFMPSETSVKDDVSRFSNLFATRTFSKTWGFPSLRIGYLLSAEANIRALNCVRGPYDVNQMSCIAVKAALANQQYVFDFVKELNERSMPAFEAFLDSRGIAFWPTKANFIFCYFPDPVPLEKKLAAEKILVRPKKDADGVLGLRISLGTLEQTNRLISLLRELLPEKENGHGPPAKKQKQ